MKTLNQKELSQIDGGYFVDDFLDHMNDFLDDGNPWNKSNGRK